MESPIELQALVKVSSEIDESDIKITFATQCIKAQENLANKLKQENQRLEELCNYMKTDNLKLATEIRNAENEIKRSSISHEAIKCANVELRKELLLAKETYVGLLERMKDGERKYDLMWEQAKQRYESIPFVQEFLEATKQVEALKDTLYSLKTEAENLDKQIASKKEQLAEKDRIQIVKLAEFLVHEREAAIKAIRAKRAELAELCKEVETMRLDQGLKTAAPTMSSSMAKMNLGPEEDTKDAEVPDESWSNLCKNICADSIMLPRLHLPSVENDDVLNVKLDIKKVTLHVAPARRTVSMKELERNSKRSKADESLDEDYISCYFKQKPEVDNNANTDAYSKMKLINILEDVKLNDNETYNIVSKINVDHLMGVTVIGEDNRKESAKDENAPTENGGIQEIYLSNRNSHNVLMPPSQFIDIIEDAAAKQTPVARQTTVSVHEITDDDMTENEDENHENQNETAGVLTSGTSAASQMDLSAANEDNCLMKDILLKKNQLDLSPQFFYAKNEVLKKKNDEHVVISKFFAKTTEVTNQQETEAANNEVTEMDIGGHKNEEQNEPTAAKIIEHEQEQLVEMKEDYETSGQKPSVPGDAPVAGLLFAHGPQGIPDCLDLSTGTTVYEEGDSDFPHCMDNSLLMSPKADDMQELVMSGNQSQGGSQDVPNFLQGFKKSGLSFFNRNASEDNPDSDTQKQENNFSFNFGCGEEKKTKGGLFSFFR